MGGLVGGMNWWRSGLVGRVDWLELKMISERFKEVELKNE